MMNSDTHTHKIIFDDHIGLSFRHYLYQYQHKRVNDFGNNSFLGSSGYAAKFSLNGLLSSKISESFEDHSGLKEYFYNWRKR
jgi:hypothetical protein